MKRRSFFAAVAGFLLAPLAPFAAKAATGKAKPSWTLDIDYFFVVEDAKEDGEIFGTRYWLGAPPTGKIRYRYNGGPWTVKEGPLPIRLDDSESQGPERPDAVLEMLGNTPCVVLANNDRGNRQDNGRPWVEPVNLDNWTIPSGFKWRHETS